MKNPFVVIGSICFGILLIILFISLEKPVPKEQRAAILKCIDYINYTLDYSTEFKENIDTDYITIDDLQDNMKNAVWVTVEGKPDWEKPFWLITIGDPLGQYYARIVYDIESNTIIGHIPIL
ncbi:MAG: hypothetical protein K0S76_2527 [Herbinix sp.]|jgi:hypothetical protein|nr:hypothetical protein [Herbinix sp.]